MSIAEANYDGIERVYDENYPARGRKGAYVYKIPCGCCGKIITKLHYRKDLVQMCDYCKLKVKNKKAVLKKELLEIRTKREIQFDKAVENIKRQIPKFQDYTKAIEIARKANEKYGSIPEAMVAIELIRLGYSIIPQQKINKYNVDFAIPKHKIIIEVDGKIFHSNDTKKEREAIIQLSVGIDWKIIHIPAEYITKDIQKVEQIIKELSKTLV